MGTDRGAGLATSVPHVRPAKKVTEQGRCSGFVPPHPTLRGLAMKEVTEPVTCDGELMSGEYGEAAELEIDAEFRRKVWALQFLPRRDRAAALRKASEERALAQRGFARAAGYGTPLEMGLAPLAGP